MFQPTSTHLNTILLVHVAMNLAIAVRLRQSIFVYYFDTFLTSIADGKLNILLPEHVLFS